MPTNLTPNGRSFFLATDHMANSSGGGGSATFEELIKVIKENLDRFYIETSKNNVNIDIQNALQDPGNALNFAIKALETNVAKIEGDFTALGISFFAFRDATTAKLAAIDVLTAEHTTGIASNLAKIGEIVGSVDLAVVNLETLHAESQNLATLLAALKVVVDRHTAELIDLQNDVDAEKIDVANKITAIDARILAVETSVTQLKTYVDAELAKRDAEIAAFQTAIDDLKLIVDEIAVYVNDTVKTFLDIDTKTLSEMVAEDTRLSDLYVALELRVKALEAATVDKLNDMFIYATEAALLADTSQKDKTFGYASDTTQLFVYYNLVWEPIGSSSLVAGAGISITNREISLNSTIDCGEL